MTSNGSLKKVILVTNDEYSFLKNQTENESKRLIFCIQQNQHFVAQVHASTSSNIEIEGTTNPPIHK